MRERHIRATAAQVAHQQNAAKNKSLLASVNHGRPTHTAVATVGHHPTVRASRSKTNPAINTVTRTNTNRTDNALTKTNTNRTNNALTTTSANVRTAGRNGRPSTPTNARQQTVRQEQATHVNRAQKAPVAQVRRTVNKQATTSHPKAAIRHTTPVRQSHITPAVHPTNRVAFEHRAPARHAPAPAGHSKTPVRRTQSQANQKHS
jgi:hypothetical protein